MMAGFESRALVENVTRSCSILLRIRGSLVTVSARNS
jgi:hypothetical protein